MVKILLRAVETPVRRRSTFSCLLDRDQSRHAAGRADFARHGAPRASPARPAGGLRTVRRTSRRSRSCVISWFLQGVVLRLKGAQPIDTDQARCPGQERGITAKENVMHVGEFSKIAAIRRDRD